MKQKLSYVKENKNCPLELKTRQNPIISFDSLYPRSFLGLICICLRLHLLKRGNKTEIN